MLVNGTWGRTLDALTLRRPLRAAVLPFLEVFRRVHAFGPLAHRPIGRGEAALWLKRLGLVGASVDELTLAELTTTVGSLDLDAFLRNLLAFLEPEGGSQPRARPSSAPSACRRW